MIILIFSPCFYDSDFGCSSANSCCISKNRTPAEQGMVLSPCFNAVPHLPLLILAALQVTSFVHRMVDTLGSSVFPYLPKAFEQLLAESQV